MTVRNLNKILRPKHVAVVGASNTRKRMSYTVLKNLRDAGFEGEIFPVNPHYQQVQGIKAYPAVGDLPHPVDLAVICTPTELIPGIVRECGECGVGGAVIITTGSYETGTAGRELDEQVKQTSAEFPDLRILGPNCMGIVVPHRNLNASFAKGTPKPGRLAFISQSGTLCTSVLDWAMEEDLGFSHFIPIGNMLDVTIGDLIDYFAEDIHTDAIILYVEAIANARQFMSAARAITQEKPIVVYKGGRFSESAAAAISHSGRMSGVDAVYEAAFERAGIVRVFDIDDMFDCAQLLARIPRPTGPRLAIVTNAGGLGVVATDSLIDRGGELARLNDKTRARLDEFLPPYWSRGDPVDILGDATPERFKLATETVLADAGVDAVLVILTPQASTNPTATAKAVAEVAAKSSKPILAVWMGGHAVRKGIDVLHHASIPTYTTPKNAVHAFAHLVAYGRNRETLLETPRDVPMSFPLDRQEQQEMRESVLSQEVEVLSEQDSKRLLQTYGIPATQPLTASSEEQAVQLAHHMGYPVAMKIVSPQITHKNEVGGVVLNVAGDDEVRIVFREIINSARLRRPEAEIQGVGVQPMASAPDGTEMILGSRKDPVFGSVILIGAGGVAAEVLEDFALGLPPLNEKLAMRMLKSLRIWPIISGERRRPAADIEQIIKTLISFSYLVADCPQIGEMDVNPLLVTPRDVLALDARVRIDPGYASDTRMFAHLAIRPYPEDLVKTIKLKDNTAVVLRPIRPEDEPLWHELLGECSPESIRLRFRSMFKEMSHETAVGFCFMDYDRELAIVAEVTGENGRKLIGVGHLLGDADRRVAEYAVLVPDSWQRHGIGSVLTDACLDIAKQWKLIEVIGETDRFNRGMIATFEHAGFELDYDVDPDVVIARKQLNGRQLV